MAEKNQKHLVRGILAGAAGGLVASWVMNVFMESAGTTITRAAERITGQSPPPPDPEPQEPREDATMKTADAVVSALTGRHLSVEQKQKAGPIVHYAFGGLMGGVYGAVTEYVPGASAGFGTAFATALFTGADLVAVPALDLSGSSTTEAPVSALASPLAAHLVYGITTESIRRIIRAF